MEIPNLSGEILFQFSRSGGKGGQNVNKVESAATGFWNINESRLFTEEQKNLLLEKLANRLTSEHVLVIKSQVHRTQLANKEEVLKKLHATVQQALARRKPRIATQKTKAATERRLEQKKKHSELKQNRNKRLW